ncbi:MAG: hypothetical protein WC881_05050 [Elusimicrobiota bacterium]
MQVDEPTLALPRADRALEIAPDNPDLLAMRADINYRVGDFPAAERDARAALRRNPRNAQAFGILKLVEGRSGPGAGSSQPAAARTSAGSIPTPHRSAQFDPTLTANADRVKLEALLREAYGKLGLGDSSAALRVLEKAAYISPKDPALLLARAQAKLAQKDAVGALQDSEAALQTKPDSARALLLRGQAKQALGQDAASVLADFKAAANMDAGLAGFYEQALAKMANQAQTAQSASDAGSSRSAPYQNIFGLDLRSLSPRAWAGIVGLAGLALVMLCIVWYHFKRRPQA